MLKYLAVFLIVVSITHGRPFEIDLEHLIEEDAAEELLDVNNALEDDDLARKMRAPEPETVPEPAPAPAPAPVPAPAPEIREAPPPPPKEPEKAPGEARGGRCDGCIPDTIECPTGKYYSPAANKCATRPRPKKF